MWCLHSPESSQKQEKDLLNYNLLQSVIITDFLNYKLLQSVTWL